ncbi:AraC family transcriptional regulator [Actinopolymorpha alba]|uniref:AraC family transcriptional regulator n=1 Tax=Actinopolymorpha alba TaxID=533267 RepID=UPI0003746A00|nr:AraC family transcriptional regulator [Actinopolymorpha alba]
MDVLSHVITAMRTGEPRSFLVACRAPWGRSYAPVQGAGFHVILQGSAVLIPADGDPIPLGVGDVVFLPRGAPHGLADSPTTPLAATDPAEDACQPEGHTITIGPDQPYGSTNGSAAGQPNGAGASTVILCGAYRLDRSRVHPLLQDLPEVIHLPARLGHHPSLRAAIDLLGGELEDPRPGSDAVVPALLDMLLLYILRAWTEDQPCDESSGWAAALRDPVVSAALCAIHRSPEHPWTVESLGAQAGLSRAAFARRFTMLIGQPPLAYLTWWRLTTAARLLRETDISLHSVAQRVGYASEFAFANAFKRAFGTAPGAYRRQHSGEARRSTVSSGHMAGHPPPA